LHAVACPNLPFSSLPFGSQHFPAFRGPCSYPSFAPVLFVLWGFFNRPSVVPFCGGPFFFELSRNVLLRPEFSPDPFFPPLISPLVFRLGPYSCLPRSSSVSTRRVPSFVGFFFEVHPLHFCFPPETFDKSRRRGLHVVLFRPIVGFFLVGFFWNFSVLKPTDDSPPLSFAAVLAFFPTGTPCLRIPRSPAFI